MEQSKIIDTLETYQEPLEEQVSSDICDIVQTFEPDLMTRGVAIDLSKTTNRIGAQNKAIEYEELAGGKASLEAASLWTIEGAIKPLSDDTVEHESTNVGVKTGRSWVGGPELCV